MIHTSNELANLFGVSVRQIQRLTLDGIIEPIGNDRPYKYDLQTVCPQYCKYLENKAANGAQRKVIADLEEEKLRAESRIKKARAEMAELQANELAGKLHRAEDVEAITTDHVLYMRSMLMAMPGKLAVDLAAIQTAAEAAERVKQEVYYILTNLANYRYDPDEYAKRVRERNGLSSELPEQPTSAIN